VLVHVVGQLQSTRRNSRKKEKKKTKKKKKKKEKEKERNKKTPSDIANNDTVASRTSSSDQTENISQHQHHRRRRSSLKSIDLSRSADFSVGPNSGLSSRVGLPTIPGTPSGMSLSRSPSPRAAGGWASPGLTEGFNSAVERTASPRRTYGELNSNGAAGGTGVTWASAKARSDEINGYPSFSTRSQNGFFARHVRKLSTSLPKFNVGGRRYSDKEKLGRGRWQPGNDSNTLMGRIRSLLGTILRKFRRVLFVLGLVLCVVLFYTTRKYPPRPLVRRLLADTPQRCTGCTAVLLSSAEEASTL
jgi:hypothetical protein